MHPPLIAEINTEAIRGNLRAIRRQTPPGTLICAVVKADAYGHGIELVLPVLSQEGIKHLAVATLNEALQLRELGWNQSILCFGPLLSANSDRRRRLNARQAVAADINCTVSSVEETEILAEEARKIGRRANVEIKIDTGMGRLGILNDQALEIITRISAFTSVLVRSVYTHFATSDDKDLTFARDQLARFNELRRHIARQGLPVKTFHAANSAALFRLPESHLDMVRLGLSIYGYWAGPRDERPEGLHPSMRLRSQIVNLRRLPLGYSIGYGRTFTTQRESLIGVVPIGYADGYRRALSNEAVMTLEAVRGLPRRTVSVVGRVSMDQTTIDLTEAGDVCLGDPVVVIDDDHAAANSIESIARKLNTIPYEITCLIGQRAKRVAL